jgi:hypothetical protein
MKVLRDQTLREYDDNDNDNLKGHDALKHRGDGAWQTGKALYTGSFFVFLYHLKPLQAGFSGRPFLYACIFIYCKQAIKTNLVLRRCYKAAKFAVYNGVAQGDMPRRKADEVTLSH